MTWLISSWMSLGLNVCGGAGGVISDPSSSSVEQKTKLVLFSLSFPGKKIAFCDFYAKQKPLQIRNSHFLPCKSSPGWCSNLTWRWQLFAWDNPNKRIVFAGEKSFMREGLTSVNLTPGGHPSFWAFLMGGWEKQCDQLIPLLPMQINEAGQSSLW